ncbi:hypothetical protein SODALDRAFT_376121 [Sodiomyces alkalinus F11]|uniref:Vacuolar ATPase assembly protein VMA22 n=1 Tax=Sodiomyces alkalinus (strain CBS 110278 / VKM F-3762 / F11) TaxID=1314773 RepID=A0A3N2Q0R4_SODAK|nr:hypothetical protein SODALDRAFT_376121 [Sodiomyces alkalinus F11]ROT40332.1 hypothetical protein SODALDRAFT_376121 [Sodiomyces alkalinus F11]
MHNLHHFGVQPLRRSRPNNTGARPVLKRNTPRVYADQIVSLARLPSPLCLPPRANWALDGEDVQADWPVNNSTLCGCTEKRGPADWTMKWMKLTKMPTARDPVFPNLYRYLQYIWNPVATLILNKPQTSESNVVHRTSAAALGTGSNDSAHLQPLSLFASLGKEEKENRVRQPATMMHDVPRIEQLLERYLDLLDEYTTLRDSLGKAQAAMYQNLARANFTAERGMRYGQDYYDDRMQASRTLTIRRQDDRSPPRFEVTMPPTEGMVDTDTKTEDASSLPVDDQQEGGEPPKEASEDTTTRTKPRHRDPIHWYGILAPMTLRQAQSQAVRAVQDIIPRLVTVNAELQHLEIEIRRARKKRAKAKAAAAAAAVTPACDKDSEASRTQVPSPEAACSPVEETS